MKDLAARFSSRKFLLTVAGLVLVTIFPDHADKIVQLVGLFMGAEGVADAVQRYTGNTSTGFSPKQPMSQNDDDYVTGPLVTGNQLDQE